MHLQHSHYSLPFDRDRVTMCAWDLRDRARLRNRPYVVTLALWGKGIGGIGRGRRGKELVEEDEIKFLLLRNGLDQWAYRR